MRTDTRIDLYIERQAQFARPILHHIRQVMHAACPEGEEAIKWGMPAFLYKGRILASMAAFKAHATLGFWKRGAVRAENAKGGAMGDFGRLTSLSDLPEEEALAALVRKAMTLVDAGAKAERRAAPKADLAVPDDLASALDAAPAARATFDAFPPGCRRDYLDWITQARRAETRARRIGQAVAWMAEGKRRNWKYEKC